jgi:hypothetical protein
LLLLLLVVVVRLQLHLQQGCVVSQTNNFALCCAPAALAAARAG